MGAYIDPIISEILSGRSYGFAADLWSVGCVLVTCLSGVPAFNVSHLVRFGGRLTFQRAQASNPDDVYNKICNVQYTLPISASSEVQDLISSILQKVRMLTLQVFCRTRSYRVICCCRTLKTVPRCTEFPPMYSFNHLSRRHLSS